MGEYKFHPLAADANDYPKAKAPILPLASVEKIFARKTNKKQSRFLLGDTRYTWDGRTALAHALKSIDSSIGMAILLPAYHCGSMVEPCLWLGMKPIFYSLNSDLSVNIDDFKSKLTHNPRIAVIVHYFGFPQNLDCIRLLSNNTKTLLIEDCAHAFFSQYNGKPVGFIGDIAVASLKKFFPCNTGGAICYNKSFNSELHLIEPSVSINIKHFYQSVEDATRYARLKLFKPFFILLDKLRRPAEKNPTTPINSPPKEFKWFLPDKFLFNAPFLARYLATHGNYERIYEGRRNNFYTLLKGLGNLENAYPLFNSLPSGVTPYIFPLILKKPDKDFIRLKKEGIPMWRWEEIIQTECITSNLYRTQLVQLPCHEDLTRTELDWMIENISKILS